MSKRKTKYNKSWGSQFNWIKFHFVHSAYYKLCQKEFLISEGGVAQIKSYATSKLYSVRKKSKEKDSLTFAKMPTIQFR